MTLDIRSLKILLVEDCPAEARLMKEVVRISGHNCIINHVENGVDALEYLDVWSKTVDIVLTDLNMPKMNGLELLKHIKTNDTLLRIPVAVLSTSVCQKDRDYCEMHGAISYMAKPIDFDAYEKMIRSFLDLCMTLIFVPTKPLNR
jgi:CheY-like chemotaxis protein